MSAQQPWIESYPEGVKWDADIPVSTLVETLKESVAKYPDRDCISFYGQKITYREFGQKVEEFAAGLQAQGIQKGTRVGLCLPNTPFYPIAYYGALMAGATVVNINPLWAEKVENYVQDSGMEVMVTTNVEQLYPHIEKELGKGNLNKIIVGDFPSAMPPKKEFGINAVNFLRNAAQKILTSGVAKAVLGEQRATKTLNKFLQKLLKTGAPVISKPRDDQRILKWDNVLKAGGKFKPVDITPEDIAVFQYTGGTTGGAPKAAVLTHANLTANLAQANMWFTAGGNSPDKEKTVAVLPLSHVFSMTVQMNLSISRGAEIILLPKFDLKELIETISNEKPTMMAAIPPIYLKMTEYKSIGKYDLSSVKIALSGAMPLPAATAEAFKNLTGVEIVEGYGLSETSPLATANPLHGKKKTNSIGLPVPGTEIKILGIDNPDIEQAQGEVGGIYIRGPQVMREYWNNLAKTKEVLRDDGFFYTGDNGFIDNEGYTHITGRSKEMSNIYGNKVYWDIVERAILKHPDISEAVVVGLQSKSGNDFVKAYLVMKEGKTIDKAGLDDFLRDKLASYEIPLALEFRDAVPKTAVGKYDKVALLKEEEAKKAASNGAPSAPQPPKP